ncbi:MULTISPECIES: flagellar basal-body MS-ring/collar protein FliF [Microbacterium]|jgi:flagellar M-ring protein FliF|uniref:Flagellar M-ring protein n=1 Tax=Microbacterium galbinum TaxID=2851646 RepID=A0ABY4IVS3_9MICO|nr:flagellar basal-body MS-ring/collar protein FliF [Microbacterium galbinum]MCK2021590.1 flagellar M-ring protein FliF [Microbacterium galbinum]UPL15800.1 flagellar M-ring protein FliF [Microbacterium galbinum]
MPKVITNSFERVKLIVSGFSVAQRTIAIIGVALLVMGAVALGAWLTKPQMSPLFTGLSAGDASAVVDQLKSAGVGYELAEGGATILVPDDQVYAQRLAAASAGLPGDTSEGYTLLDKMGVTASEFQQSVTYKRAIEGELASTIGAMDGISTASVQLAIPEESVFVSEQQTPTASVFVKTRNGSTLSDEKIEAIIHLTSASVPGMTPEDVAVTDQNGTVLSAVGSGVAGNSSKQATEHEARVAASVNRMLETIVGPGNATVTVSADVANSTSERMDETYSAPEGDLSASEQTKTETYTGGQGGGTGVLGPDNIAVPNGADGDGAYEFEETSRNNAVNKSTEKTITPAGEVTRQTVSIALNRGTVTGVTAAQIETLVASAAGIDVERGDTIAVEFVEFAGAGANAAQTALAAAEAEQAAQFQQELVRSAIIGGSILLAVIILVVFLSIRLRMKRRIAYTDEGPIEYLATLTESEEQKLKSLKGLQDREALTAPLLPQVSPTLLDVEEEPEREQILVERRRREIDDIARREPQATATALASLMDESTV